MSVELDQLPLGSSLSDNHVLPAKDPSNGQTQRVTWLTIKNTIKSWFSSVAISGAYSDLSGKPINLSAFTNDANYSSFSTGDYKHSAQTANHGQWLLCNGTTVSRSTYSTLFALIGISFGSGDGSTTFIYCG